MIDIFLLVVSLIGKMLIDISKGIITMIRYLELAVNSSLSRPKMWSRFEPLKMNDSGYTKMIPSMTASFHYRQIHYKRNTARNLCSLTLNSTQFDSFYHIFEQKKPFASSRKWTYDTHARSFHRKAISWTQNIHAKWTFGSFFSQFGVVLSNFKGM